MSEFDWIARYFAPLATRDGAAGLLDDVAKLSGAGVMITTDALVEGIHFLSSDPIETIAQKLVRVNVSDILAKGGHPDEAVLTLGWPGTRSEAELETFAAALGAELAEWGAALIGGDTVRAPGGLFLSLTLTGRAAGPRPPVRRAGAQAGDVLWISGPIGVGYAGLRDAKAGRASVARAYYRAPKLPPLALADLIATYATASMDVSDGLIGDALKLVEASGCGGQIALDRVPLFESGDDLDDALAQCTGGDDYQCLFAAPEGAGETFKRLAPYLLPIGRVEAEAGLTLLWRGKTVDLPKQAGFAHGIDL